MTRHTRSPIRDEDAIVTMAWTQPWTPTEAEFTDLFLEIAAAKGWHHAYHVHDSRRSLAGFPDWVMMHTLQQRICFVELKGFGGVASDAQRDYLAAVNDAGGEGYLIGTTGDYAQDASRIAELLSERPRR